MNIFVLDPSPRIAAQSLCDVHVVKMILESAQLLSTQDRLAGVLHGYAITHENHPCRICLSNPANYLWLSAHLGLFSRNTPGATAESIKRNSSIGCTGKRISDACPAGRSAKN